MNGISENLAIAFQHQQAGRVFQAEQIYYQILQDHPNHLDALYLLGTLAHQLGDRKKAIALYRQALSINPALASVHSNLGIALKQQGLFTEARHHYQLVIAQLDLVLTIDTSVAHLAGALGQQTWVVLSYIPDWR